MSTLLINRCAQNPRLGLRWKNSNCIICGTVRFDLHRPLVKQLNQQLKGHQKYPTAIQSAEECSAYKLLTGSIHRQSSTEAPARHLFRPPARQESALPSPYQCFQCWFEAAHETQLRWQLHRTWVSTGYSVSTNLRKPAQASNGTIHERDQLWAVWYGQWVCVKKAAFWQPVCQQLRGEGFGVHGGTQTPW